MTGLLLKIRNPSIFYDQPSPENQEFRIFHEILERDEEKKLYFLGHFRAFPLIFSKWILKIILKLHLTLQYVSTDEFRLSKTFFIRFSVWAVKVSKIQIFKFYDKIVKAIIMGIFVANKTRQLGNSIEVKNES